MVAAFILTRTFAISALFVGAFDLVHAAPVPFGADVALDPRNCRDGGCMAEVRNCRSGGCMRSLPAELMDVPDVPVVREPEPEARSILDDILKHVSPASDDALANRSLDEAPRAVAEESRSAVDFGN